jgi:tetratricopeptide (TPR) repeat protein
VVKARTQLSRQQQSSILAEANELYLAGQDQSSSDRAEANDLFAQSAEKYQLLFESGVRNSRLQGNLGNAYLQSGQLGRAIAAYHRALRHDPRNGQAQANLRFAEARVSSMGEHAAKSPRDSEVAGAVSTAELFRSTTQRLVGLIGMGTLRTMLGAASLLFWGLLIARLFGVGGGTIRLAVLPLVLLIFSGSLVWMEQPDAEFQLAILTSQPTELRLGDGEEFDVEHRFENSTGRPVKLIDRRGDWLRIRTPDDREGWIPANEAEQIDSLAPDVTDYRSNE